MASNAPRAGPQIAFFLVMSLSRRILLLCFWLCIHLHAENLENIFTNTYIYPGSAVFLVPNETLPVQMSSAISQVPEDTAYLTVGTLRGWIGYALCRNCTSLLLVDRDSGIVHFNRLFEFLVRVSRGGTPAERMRDFRFLALNASHEEWVNRLRERNLLESFRSIMGSDTLSAWEWWRIRVRNNENFRQIQENRNRDVSLRGANPFLDIPIFRRISEAVDARRVGISWLNLQDAHSMNLLIESVQRSGVRVGIFDASNMYDVMNRNQYPGPQGVRNLFLQALSNILHPDARLLVTNMSGSYLSYGRQDLENYPSIPFDEHLINAALDREFKFDCIGVLENITIVTIGTAVVTVGGIWLYNDKLDRDRKKDLEKKFRNLEEKNRNP